MRSAASVNEISTSARSAPKAAPDSFPALLGLERGKLISGELRAFGVGEDAVGGAGDVAQMEGDGRKAKWPE